VALNAFFYLEWDWQTLDAMARKTASWLNKSFWVNFARRHRPIKMTKMVFPAQRMDALQD
jgi:hypothetical protein